jgi:hypothetical protein
MGEHLRKAIHEAANKIAQDHTNGKCPVCGGKMAYLGELGTVPCGGIGFIGWTRALKVLIMTCEACCYVMQFSANKYGLDVAEAEDNKLEIEEEWKKRQEEAEKERKATDQPTTDEGSKP